MIGFCTTQTFSLQSQTTNKNTPLYPRLEGTQEVLYTEVRSLLHSEVDSMRIIVLFRIQYDVLVFLQVNSYQGQYVATPSLDIECRDTNGIIKFRSEWRDSIFARSFDQTNADDEYAYGIYEFSVAKNMYSVNISLSERNGQAIKKLRVPKVTIPEYGFSQPIFTESNYRSTVIQPMIINGNISFSKSQQYAIIPMYGNIEGEITASLKRLRANEEYAKHVKNVTATRVDIEPDVSLDIDPADIGIALSNSKLQIIEMSDQKIMRVHFPDNTIAPGRYSLVISFKNGKNKKDSSVFEFSCIWETMPKTLISAKYALEVMKYILTEDQYDSMNSGSDIDMRKSIVDWWKKNDPTPQTIYDEAMAEYFRRADKAFSAFQTINESDGVMTERGKIALLYGFPKKIDKNMMSGNVQEEIWYYPDILRKKYVFQQQSAGRFLLKSIEDM